MYSTMLFILSLSFASDETISFLVLRLLKYKVLARVEAECATLEDCDINLQTSIIPYALLNVVVASPDAVEWPELDELVLHWFCRSNTFEDVSQNEYAAMLKIVYWLARVICAMSLD